MMHFISGSIRRAFIALVLSATAALAQNLNYNHTAFVHGFGSGKLIWLAPAAELGGVSPRQYIGARVALDSVHTPDWDDETVFQTEFENLRDTITTRPAGHAFVLVGHSLGVLVSRYTYINGGQAARDRTAAILAVAAPHQGVILADSSAKLGAFMVDLKNKCQAASDWAHGTLLGMLTGGLGLIALFFTNFPSVQVPTALADVKTLPALRTTSSVVVGLGQQTLDASIPRANIIAKLENNTFAVLRLAAALKGTTEQAEIDDFRKNRSKLNTCTVVGAFIIYGIPAAIKCQQAERALGKLDEMWLRFANGSTQQQKCAWVFDLNQGQVYRCWNYQATNTTRATDGVVPNDFSNYPGSGSGNFFQPPVVVGTNHMSVYRRTSGANVMVTAMLDHFLMRQPSGGGGGPPGAPSVTIQGQSSIHEGAGCAWNAVVNGGVAPYSYSWTVNGLSEGWDSSSLSYTNNGNSFTIAVTVTDANNQTSSPDYFSVSIASGQWCQ